MKPAARKGDQHACADTGPNMGASCIIEAGSPNITINGLPAARVGDAVGCRLATDKNPVIAEGSASVFFNGKSAARMGDRVEKGGSISSGSGNVFIGDSGTLITVGDNINVVFGSGCGIYLNCGSPASDSFKTSLANALAMLETAKRINPILTNSDSNVTDDGTALTSAEPTLSTNTTNIASSSIPLTNTNFISSEISTVVNTTIQTVSECASSSENLFNMMVCSAEVNLLPLLPKEKEDEYEYYVVTAEGFNTKLAVLSPLQLMFDFSGVEITDYFEEGRWMMSEPDLGEKSNEKINQGKQMYNRQQLRDQSRSAWKGQYRTVQLTSTEIPLSRELTPADMVKTGSATGLVMGLSWLQKGGLRNDLLAQIKLKHDDVKAKMPDNGGVLIEVHYILRPIPGDQTYIAMDGGITVLGGYPEYATEIKKYMTDTFIENKYDSATQHEFLFVWAVKK